jgi:putative polyhydroxyalkanoate system protein
MITIDIYHGHDDCNALDGCVIFGLGMYEEKEVLMADIQTSRNHNLDLDELRSQLEDLAAELNKKYGIKSDFGENEAKISGSIIKNGFVNWSPDSLTLELSLGLAGKLFKNQIAKEIEKRINEIIAV